MEKTIAIQIKEAVEADRQRIADEIAMWRGRTIQDVPGIKYQVVDINGVVAWIRQGGSQG